MKVSASAAGFSDGEASIKAPAAPPRRVRSCTAAKTGATQHEQSMRGTPARPPTICDRREESPKRRATHAEGTTARTAAPMRTPKARAGHTIAR